MRDEKMLAEAAAFCARKLLEGGRRPDMDGELELMEAMLRERGLNPPARPVLKSAYISALMGELLSISNALYGYPHKDCDLDKRVIPAFARLFADLERPAMLADAFDGHHREAEAFPRPCDIEARLAAGARAPARPAPKPEEGKITPGFARQCFEKFKKRVKG